MKNYTLIMTAYKFDFNTGNINKENIYVKDCKVYHNSDNKDEITFLSNDKNTTIQPYMINDNGERIYYLKNWNISQSHYVINENQLKVVIFDNDMYPNDPNEVKKYFNDLFDKLINNINTFKNYNF